MHKKITLLIALMIFSYSLSASWVKGYIITNENDTIQGFIEKKLNQNYAQAFKYQINFKDQEPATPKTYKVGEIKGFGLPIKLNFEHFECKLSSLYDGQEPKLRFLRRIMDGNFKVYFMAYSYLQEKYATNQMTGRYEKTTTSVEVNYYFVETPDGVFFCMNTLPATYKYLGPHISCYKGFKKHLWLETAGFKNFHELSFIRKLEWKYKTKECREKALEIQLPDTITCRADLDELRKTLSSSDIKKFDIRIFNSRQIREIKAKNVEKLDKLNFTKDEDKEHDVWLLEKGNYGYRIKYTTKINGKKVKHYMVGSFTVG